MTSRGAWILVLGALAGLVVSVVNYFDASSGIAGEPGTLLVIASTAILAVLGWLMAARRAAGRFLPGFLAVSSLLDIAGTSFAGLLLHSQALVASMFVGLAGWLLHALRSRPAIA
jgi:hypothetical protein